MSVHIGVVIVVLVIGHVLTFLLFASDISQHALTSFDRAFLWGKASQIAGWSLILGGEFLWPVVLLAGCDVPEAFRIAERIRATVERSDPASIRHTVSIGIATETGGGTDLDALLRRADDRMYRAKHLGRNRVLTEG